jgi:hypothetical protein
MYIFKWTEFSNFVTIFVILFSFLIIGTLKKIIIPKLILFYLIIPFILITIFNASSLPRFYSTWICIILFSVLIYNFKISNSVLSITSFLFFIYCFLEIIFILLGISEQTYEIRNGKLRAGFGFNGANTMPLFLSNIILVFYIYKSFTKVFYFLIPIYLLVILLSQSRTCFLGFLVVIIFNSIVYLSKLNIISFNLVKLFYLVTSYFTIFFGFSMFFMSEYIYEYFPFIDHLFSNRIHMFILLKESIDIKTLLLGGIDISKGISIDHYAYLNNGIFPVDSIYVSMILYFGLIYTGFFFCILIKVININIKNKNYKYSSLILWIIVIGCFEDILAPPYLFSLLLLIILIEGISSHKNVLNFKLR